MALTCYFSKLDTGPLRFIDQDNNPASPCGMFAYLIYHDGQKVLVMWPLTNYESQHHGLHMITHALGRRTQGMFSTGPTNPLLPSGEPACGGEILLGTTGNIVLFNFMSGAYSQGKRDFHDDNPALPDVLARYNLPPDRFITIRQTNQFRDALMSSYFEKSGAYKPHVCIALAEDRIWRQLTPAPVQTPQPEPEQDIPRLTLVS